MSNYHSNVSLSNFDEVALYKAYLARKRSELKIPNYLDSIQDIEREQDAGIDIVERKPSYRKITLFHRPDNDFDPFDPAPASRAVA